MLKVIGSGHVGDVPNEAVFWDEVERHFLESASADEKARFWAQSRARQRELLEVFAQQLHDRSTDERRRGEDNLAD
jgi:hypothetical protein